jgi:hypothetical protein
MRAHPVRKVRSGPAHARPGPLRPGRHRAARRPGTRPRTRPRRRWSRGPQFADQLPVAAQPEVLDHAGGRGVHRHRDAGPARVGGQRRDAARGGLGREAVGRGVQHGGRLQPARGHRGQLARGGPVRVHGALAGRVDQHHDRPGAAAPLHPHVDAAAGPVNGRRVVGRVPGRDRGRRGPGPDDDVLDQVADGDQDPGHATGAAGRRAARARRGRPPGRAGPAARRRGRSSGRPARGGPARQGAPRGR